MLSRISLAVAGLALLVSAAPLPQDVGAAGAWQAIRKLTTTASVLHTTAHPDDENGGVLVWLSRGEGARVGLLTLTRGESGDNAIGPELFDALGLIRTEELLAADRYYGVDDQYFTSAIDYGFSKRLDEAFEKWDRTRVVGDMVRAIRVHRPLVIVSRFQGNARDGHGNHQAAGVLTAEAFEAAGDANRFPEHAKEGLRPWAPLKLYVGAREDDKWTLRLETGRYSPWLGRSYADFARAGLAFQRSQNSGRVGGRPGGNRAYFRRVASRVNAPDKEESFFDGLDTSLARFPAVEREVQAAISAFSMADPSAAVPHLARGLRAAREARQALGSDPDAAFTLDVKARQFSQAINLAIGLELTAVAEPAGTPAGDQTAATQTMPPVVSFQAFQVRATMATQGATPVTVQAFRVLGSASTPADERKELTLAPGEAVTVVQQMTAPGAIMRPHFSRASLAENHYTFLPGVAPYLPRAPAAWVAALTYAVEGVGVDAYAPVVRREADPPFGVVSRELEVLPAISVSVSPSYAIVPRGPSTGLRAGPSTGLRAGPSTALGAGPSKGLAASAPAPLVITVDLEHNKPAPTEGELALALPDGWKSDPPSHRVTFSRAGERASHRFAVRAPAIESREYSIQAIALAEGRRFAEGYQTIRHRDLETRYLFRPSIVHVRGVDVRVRRLRVGYVMGAGDEVPAGIAQLGAEVRLLGESDLASARLGAFDAIVTGTRAYGARADLRKWNRRLLEYVEAGGNLIVLYNTPGEFDPKTFAPFPADLPRDAEEVSEEDSPVIVVARSHRVLTWPNTIGPADFEGWVEQRGSKFFKTWAGAYTPIIETFDKGQAPQRGGWLTARYGKGHYTYFAYALHRQLPFGVPGVYRILANLLSLSASGGTSNRPTGRQGAR